MVKWARCAVKKGALFQQVRVLPRQTSSRSDRYPTGRGGSHTHEVVSLQAVEPGERSSDF
jgi:hypothetical protein